MNVYEKYAPYVGRVLLGLIFLMSGIGKIFDWQATAGYMSSMGMPWIPFFFVGAILLEIAGGTSLIFGYRPRCGALALILFLIPTTLIFHAFWNYQGMENKIQMISFMKNLSILGALILVSAKPDLVKKT